MITTALIDGVYCEIEEDSALECEFLTYAQKVERYIRERYTASDELALIRQRDAKPEEFEEYYAFCEACKVRAKEQQS